MSLRIFRIRDVEETNDGVNVVIRPRHAVAKAVVSALWLCAWLSVAPDFFHHPVGSWLGIFFALIVWAIAVSLSIAALLWRARPSDRQGRQPGIGRGSAALGSFASARRLFLRLRLETCGSARSGTMAGSGDTAFGSSSTTRKKPRCSTTICLAERARNCYEVRSAWLSTTAIAKPLPRLRGEGGVGRAAAGACGGLSA